jgi:hypothetical protein
VPIGGGPTENPKSDAGVHFVKSGTGIAVIVIVAVAALAAVAVAVFFVLRRKPEASDEGITEPLSRIEGPATEKLAEMDSERLSHEFDNPIASDIGTPRDSEVSFASGED